MPDKQIRMRRHCVPKPLNDSRLRGFIEIDKHVTAEYDIEIAFAGIVAEIVIIEIDLD